MGVISIRFSEEDETKIHQLAHKMRVTKTEALRILTLRGLAREDNSEVRNLLLRCLHLCAYIGATSRLAIVNYDPMKEPPPDTLHGIQQEAQRLFEQAMAGLDGELPDGLVMDDD